MRPSWCATSRATWLGLGLGSNPNPNANPDPNPNQVRHFAGNVCYMAAHFLDKNNDTLHSDVERALCASGSGLIAAMFKPAEPKAGAGGARRKASAQIIS